MKLSPSPLLLGLTLLALPLLRPAAGAQQPGTAVLLSEGFEMGGAGLPLAWAEASTGELRTEVGYDAREAKEGKRCLRFGVPAWYSGEARLIHGGIALRKEQRYSLGLWLRAEEFTPVVTAAVGKAGAGGAPYLSRSFAIGKEWRRCEVTGTAPADDPSAVFSLRFAGSGELLVDEIILQEGDLPLPDPTAPAPPRPPLAKGNRVFNSSFELAPEGRPDGWAAVGSPEVVIGDAPDRARFLRVKASETPLEGRPVPVRYDRPYSISAYLRSPDEGAQAEVALVEVGSPARRIAQTFDLKPGWDRYDLAAPLPCEGSLRYYLAISPAGKAKTLDVDAVQVEEGGITPYRPDAPLELSLILAAEQRRPRRDGFVEFEVDLRARGPLPEGTALRYSLEGFYGETLTVGGQPVEPEVISGRYSGRLRVPATGAARLVVDGIVQNDLVASSETLLIASGAGDPPAAGPASPPPVASPSFYSWMGLDEPARSAAGRLARAAILERANGGKPGAVPEKLQPRLFDTLGTADDLYYETDGTPKPTVAAAGALGRFLAGAETAGRLEGDSLRAYAFRQGADTVVAAWSPTGLTEPLALVLKLLPRQIRAWNLMGNPRGLKIEKETGTVTVSLRPEPLYLRFTDQRAENVLMLLKSALTAPPPAPARTPKPPANMPQNGTPAAKPATENPGR